MTEALSKLENLYTPHTGQLPIHQSKAKIKVVETARRFGKSRAALGELINAYLDAMNRKYDPTLIPPFHAWIVVPNFSQGKQAWNELLGLIPKEYIYSYREDDKELRLMGFRHPNDYGFVEVKSAHDPESLQTVGLDFLWINEAQDIPDKAFQKLMPILNSPGRLGRAIVEGIPAAFPEHPFWRMYDEAISNKKGFFGYKATYLDNPLLTKDDIDEIEAYKNIMPIAAWERMFLAKRNRSSGFFKNIDECIDGNTYVQPKIGVQYVAGLDVGLRTDPTVLMVIERESRKVAHAFSWDASGDLTWPHLREAIVQTHKEWGFTDIVMDTTAQAGLALSQELLQDGLPILSYTLTPQSRPQLLMQLSVALEHETVKFPHIEQLIRELRVFQERVTPGGYHKAEAPPGEHDDHVFALALGLHACVDPFWEAPSMEDAPRRRYMPTQAEVNNGISNPNTFGNKLLKDRKAQRRKFMAGVK